MPFGSIVPGPDDYDLNAIPRVDAFMSDPFRKT